MFGTKTKTLVQIRANVPWQAFRDEATGRWYAVCRPLNLNAVGDSWTDMLETAADAIDVLFRSLMREGELERFLRRNGWAPLQQLPTEGRVQFDVPFTVEQRARYEELDLTPA